MWRQAVSALVITCALQGGGMRIPPVDGHTLSGNAVELPAGLQGKVGVLIVGFSQGSRGEAQAWGQRLAADYGNSQTVVYYEMPVLESVPRLLRGYVLKKIGESVSERGKAHFLPVLDHEKEWKALAGYHAADDAYLLVVDATGTVRWKTEGALTESSYAQLKQQLESARPGAAR